MLQTTPSRRVAARPGANSRRSTTSASTAKTASATQAHRVIASHEVEGDPEHDVDREQLPPHNRGRLAARGPLPADQHGQQQRPELEAVEAQRHGELADEE